MSKIGKINITIPEKVKVAINGSILNIDANSELAIRCVRGKDYDYDSNDFALHGDGTITDGRTGLIWQKCNYGNLGDNCAMYESRTQEFNWKSALAACSELELADYADWRLPSVKELESIVLYNTNMPTINRTYFPNTLSRYYWTSTTVVGNSNNKWIVNFYDGDIKPEETHKELPIRCVRN